MKSAVLVHRAYLFNDNDSWIMENKLKEDPMPVLYLKITGLIESVVYMMKPTLTKGWRLIGVICEPYFIG